MRNTLALIRARQWVKNGIVFIGILFSPYGGGLFVDVCSMALAFCAMSSAVYIMNDIADRGTDKLHPKKKERPITKGIVKVPTAALIGFTLAIIGLVIAESISIEALTILVGYGALNLAYSLKLKRVVILDVFCIATGFMLRILAGTVGVGIATTSWLILSGFMFALFFGFSKRRVEIQTVGQKKARHVLTNYSPGFIDQLVVISATCAIITYSLYTLNPKTILQHGTEALLYTVPFIIYIVARYLFLMHQYNVGENPSRELIQDCHILTATFGWAFTTYLILN